jgi:hypothetical protein
VFESLWAGLYGRKPVGFGLEGLGRRFETVGNYGLVSRCLSTNLELFPWRANGEEPKPIQCKHAGVAE